MAKMRNVVAGKFSGNAGSFRFGQTAGTSIVGERVYTNKSKGYGASYTQRVQRCKIANIANAFALLKPVLVRAFEGKKTNQSWYNAFAAANLGRNLFCLPKDVASEGYFLAEGMQISKGSLRPVRMLKEGDTVCSEISCRGLDRLGSSTVAQVSAALLAQNDWLRVGDQLTWVNVEDYSYVESGHAVRQLLYTFELTLDLTDNREMSSLPGFASIHMKIEEEEYLSSAGRNVTTCILSRYVNGVLKVSSAFLESAPVDADMYDKFKAAAWIEKAAASYGFQDKALLDPDL